MIGESKYRFEVTWRWSGGTHVARCNGATASCTSNPDDAAKAAALKHWNRFLGTSGVDGSQYQLSITPIGEGAYMATFERKDS
jgi:hypothetical protein